MCVAAISDELEDTFLTALATHKPLSLEGQTKPIPKVEQPDSQLTTPSKGQLPLLNPPSTAELPAPAYSPATTRSRTYYHPNPNMISLRVVANREPGEGVVQVHAFFSEDPSKFIEGCNHLTLIYNLTWNDLQIALSHCCPIDEKLLIIEAARAYADELTGCHAQHHIPTRGRCNSRSGH